MIQMFHVHKYYGKDRPVLEDINLHVEKGEFVSLIGPSGAGKSTLLKLIFCEGPVDKGQILINGKNISHISEKERSALRRNMGFIFQDLKLIQRKTVYENIAFPLEIMGVPSGDIRRRVPEVLKMVGLECQHGRYPLSLSGGEQQRVAVARALVVRPTLLLADEPAGNLDETLSSDLVTLLKSVHTAGTTMIVATHHRHLLSKTSKRTLFLQQGRIVPQGFSA